MKIKIGNVEFSDLTQEEVDDLIARYGNFSADAASTETKPRGGKSHNVGANAADGVVLQKLVEAGSNGVPTNDLGEILGKRGKGARGALRHWSKRVGLSSDDNLDTFEDCRSGTQRGLRLKNSFMDVAKALLNSR